MADDAERVEKPIRYVVRHLPGPAWQRGVDFREQPGVQEHVEHFARWHAEGKLELGGPFLVPDSGGMMVTTKGIGFDEFDAYVLDDPAVKSGLLEAEITPWFTAMESASLSEERS